MKKLSIPVRSVWTHEASQFTPWLRKNINLLERSLSINLSSRDVVDEMNDRRKVKIGDFYPDILAEDEQGGLVIIENQLEGTDHSHLGQLITYSAGVDAKTVIWVASSFRDDHRWALDWLNNQAHGTIKYFGVEISTFKVENSDDRLIEFSVVAHPPDWQRKSGEPKNKPKKPMHKHIFLKQIEMQIREQRPSLKPFVEDATRLKIATVFGNYGISFRDWKNLRVLAQIETENKNRIFRVLLSKREEIERDFGATLSWEEKYLAIACSRPLPDFTDSGNLIVVADWAVAKLIRIMDVLDTRIMAQMPVKE
jgi:hypothetical protein